MESDEALRLQELGVIVMEANRRCYNEIIQDKTSYRVHCQVPSFKNNYEKTVMI